MAQHPDGPIVTIAPGDVRGFWRGEPGEREASAAFLGIPFAQAPVGELRFAAPLPPEPWNGVRDAHEYGATAHRTDPGDTLIPEPAIPGDSTLNVNVFTPVPGDTEARLPVMVYIHGGGYTAGSPASPWYDGRAFNRDGVVTVTLSYRLGFDGFGHIPGAPSNRGVRDWLAALEWVRDNIAAFGGDPARVTIAGQSAGGGAVLTLLGMPQAQHLFHSAWAMSAALADVSAERARTLSAKLAHLAGVEPNRDGFASVAEDTLHGLQEKAATADSSNPLAGILVLLQDGLSWGPMVDGDLIGQPTLVSLRAGVGADKPLVLGSNDDEFTMVTDSAKGKLRLIPASLALGRLEVGKETRTAYLAANFAQRRKGTAAVLGRYVTDVVFRSTVVKVAEARAAAASPLAAATWVYRFSWVSPARGWALHCLDVPFWFDCLDAPGVTAIAGDAPPRRLAGAVHGSAVGLIRDGDPGWPAWSDRPGATRMFGGEASRPDVDLEGYASVRALV
ncbi:carboxylesterase/lipase family protein [Microbacterium sp. CFBP9034]|uniref:carboxylesterase/lipase family protein n=1 Tax=Microbacterium sp. CFBP9034 TaxID=3096540 RepID=UPI002A6ACE36|nr:carboxylesterase family protein [Microbacterium sp. CFBP9034]MDY0908420.1 carboxylesterase family protein [Microbacterium sp. CFBP9034]